MQPNITAPKIHKGGFRITDKCVCLVLEFSAFGNTRTISNVGIKGSGAVVETNAAAKRVRVTKSLLESPELAMIHKHKGQIQNWVYTRTITSLFKGVCLLPNGLINQVNERLKEASEEREKLVGYAVDALTQRVREAKRELGPAFNQGDYPTPEEFRASFAMGWRFVAFETPKSLKEVSAEIFKAEQAKAEAQWKEATASVTAILRAEMAELVSNMVEKLGTGPDGKKKVFRNTLVGEAAASGGNITDFLAVFEARNITDDKALAGIVSKAKALLNGVDADQLRDNDALRAKVHEGMTKLNEQLGTMVENAPTRSYDL
jgi:hypothetical protein